VCVRNALDSVADQHKLELEQAQQQAVAEYCAKAALSDTASLSDNSILTDLQASNAVSLLTFFVNPLSHAMSILITDISVVHLLTSLLS